MSHMQVDNELPPPSTTSLRKRAVIHEWLRDPKGSPLPRPPPTGVRTPNGIIWAHSLANFMWIQRIPDVNVMTVWSRSMIKEFGENYDESEFAAPEPPPRRRKPWPVLKLPRRSRESVYPPLGVLDEGSDHEDFGTRVIRTCADDSEDDDDDEPSTLDPPPALAGDAGHLSDLVIPNDPDDPIMSPWGMPYAFLWKPEVREAIAPMSDLLETLLMTSCLEPPTKEAKVRQVADGNGLIIGIQEQLPSPEHSGAHNVQERDPGDAVQNLVENSLGDAKIDTPAEEKILQPQSGCTDKMDVTAVSSDVRSSESGPSKANEDLSMQIDDSASKNDDVESTGQDTTATDESSNSPLADEDMSMKAEDQTEDSIAALKELDVEALVQDHQDKRKVDEAPELAMPLDRAIIADIPKLEEFIPEQFFPDTLMVHESENTVVEYARIFPNLDRNEDHPERIAHLYSTGVVIGQGHHSLVQRMVLTLPPPLSAYGRTKRVMVAAKMAFPVRSARKFLRHEAETFAKFPRHLQEEWCGYNFVPPIRHPVPVGAVVPKFYGYYVPVGKDGKKKDETWEGYDDNDGTRVSSHSPILLMEECGVPIEPSEFSLDDRSECYSLILRLHLADFVQGSMYIRNVLWQPGPLTVPPEKRSRKTPSFRIIDFGRAVNYKDLVEHYRNRKSRKDIEIAWQQQANDEEALAQGELRIDDWDF
ncbi:hypothetical protein AcV5_009639 [Taiwanofungus camphoratus]|nr:hypothetical protein AcV5_009639 [Antrodia cinnamomea]